MASTYPLSRSDAALAASDRSTPAPRASFWRRLYDAMVATQSQRADRELERFFSIHPKFTDSIERAAYHHYLRY